MTKTWNICKKRLYRVVERVFNAPTYLKTPKENTMYNAKSLMSIANFWGEDITPEQEIWLATEADDLPETEKGKFFDLYYGYEA